MSPGLWFLVALGAVVLAGWAYGAREERVAGRAGPAAVRAVAVFLILGALALPALRDSGVGAPERVVLLDISRSMTLPVRAGDAGGATRLDSALALLPGLAPDRIYLFGDRPVPARLDSLEALGATHDASRLEPALQAARLGGADSVWVLTDGEWTDRDAQPARRLRVWASGCANSASPPPSPAWRSRRCGRRSGPGPATPSAPRSSSTPAGDRAARASCPTA